MSKWMSKQTNKQTNEWTKVRGPVLKLSKKWFAPNAILELNHVYIYYMTSCVHVGGKIPPTAGVIVFTVASQCFY